MKKLHKPDLYCWSEFDPDRNIDFHSYLWLRDEGNVAFDPLPMSEHDANHMDSFGNLSHIIISNSDHIRNAVKLAKASGAIIWGPNAEKDSFPFECAMWLTDGDTRISGLDVYAMNGSKTPGELAFIVEGHTLITGDLIRAHEGGRLCILPDAKLSDKALAIKSIERLAEDADIEAVLPGDGWPAFRQGQVLLTELVDSLQMNLST